MAVAIVVSRPKAAPYRHAVVVKNVAVVPSQSATGVEEALDFVRIRRIIPEESMPVLSGTLKKMLPIREAVAGLSRCPR